MAYAAETGWSCLKSKKSPLGRNPELVKLLGLQMRASPSSKTCFTLARLFSPVGWWDVGTGLQATGTGRLGGLAPAWSGEACLITPSSVSISRACLSADSLLAFLFCFVFNCGLDTLTVVLLHFSSLSLEDFLWNKHKAHYFRNKMCFSLKTLFWILQSQQSFSLLA